MPTKPEQSAIESAHLSSGPQPDRRGYQDGHDTSSDDCDEVASSHSEYLLSEWFREEQG